jgi:hypothetical protein
VKRVRVALDVNVARRIVTLLRAGFHDQGFEFMWEPEFAPHDATDEYWLDVFQKFGGEIVLSADKNIARRPHQMLAFRDTALKGFFFTRNWSQKPLRVQAAHAVFWWPRIARKASLCKPGEAFWVPSVIQDKEFREVKLPSKSQIEKAAKPRRKKSGGA